MTLIAALLVVLTPVACNLIARGAAAVVLLNLGLTPSGAFHM